MSHTLEGIFIKFEETIKGQMLIETFAEAVVPNQGLFKLTFTQEPALFVGFCLQRQESAN